MGTELFSLVKVKLGLIPIIIANHSGTNKMVQNGTNTSSLFCPGTYTITAAIIPWKSVAHKTSYEK